MNYIRTAHGAAAAHGAILVVEQPPLDEIPAIKRDPNATPLALPPSLPMALPPKPKKGPGRKFDKGNKAAAGRGPSLTTVTQDPQAPATQKSIQRKAASLKTKREQELVAECGFPLSSAVKVELVAWARNTAWAAHFDSIGDPLKAATLTEKASAHGLKALGFVQRESEARLKSKGWVDPLEAFYEKDEESK